MKKVFGSQTDFIARLRRNANCLNFMLSRGVPTYIGFTEGFGKGIRVYSGKISVAVVEENRHGLPKPHGSDDQIKSMIAVDIARDDLKAADRRSHLKRLPPCSTELQLNKVVRAG